MKSKIAAITGGTRGIGLGIAAALAREGFDLALCGRRDEGAVREALEGLRQSGRRVTYARADVADPADRQSFLDGVARDFGRLDLLVNNAGMAPRVRADILEAEEESFDEIMAVNLRGPYFLTQKAARWMVDQKKADPSLSPGIVFVGSVSATMASVNRGDYCMSKAALAMANRLWAARLAEFGIPVYEVRPGIVETDMTAGVKAKYDALIAQGLIPQQRWGKPEDVGRAVAALARGDLAYSTGQVILVDGGLTLERL